MSLSSGRLSLITTKNQSLGAASSTNPSLIGSTNAFEVLFRGSSHSVFACMSMTAAWRKDKVESAFVAFAACGRIHPGSQRL